MKCSSDKIDPVKKDQLLSELPQLWNHWQKFGIETENQFPVLFTFYSAYEQRSAQFRDAMANLGFAVERKSTRTMLFFKGYEVSAELTNEWSIEAIRLKIEELTNLAKEYSTIHEGVFARKLN